MDQLFTPRAMRNKPRIRPMEIAANKVVSIHYTLRDGESTLLDSSSGADPLVYLHGHHQIVPGLEKALEGLAAGATKDVIVPPEEGYGQRQEDAIQNVPLADFPEEIPREEGLQIFAEGPNGEQFPLWISSVQEDTITLDGNHPLAGKSLYFNIQVVDIRDATEEELAHGHAHGPGGHHH